MIDDLQTIESLMERIRAALPMRAHVGRDVLRTLRREAPQASLSHQCDVTEVRYAGDEGGILCTLDFDDHASKAVYIVSITHVTFERRNRCGETSRATRSVASNEYGDFRVVWSERLKVADRVAAGERMDINR